MEQDKNVKITVSLVTYHNKHEDIINVINSVLNTELDIKFFISDNSENQDIKTLCNDDRITYIYNDRNDGFGAGHNIAIKKAKEVNSDFHIVINPDIYYDKGTLETIVNFMIENEKVGLAMPKIMYPSGEIQYVCKLLPNPWNLFSRGFAPKNIKWIEKINEKYEMRFTGYSETMHVPYISGCFMVFRSQIFEEIGMFDEKIFMYLEETDITRRILERYQTVMIADAIAYHKWEKAAHKSKKYKIISIKSAIYYFNKWGWFYDQKRRKINKEIYENWKYHKEV
ncbi:MAG: glycosyltransferase [Culicoidibacterales bacterium]